jgi:predicted PurR-regulated permease PerM
MDKKMNYIDSNKLRQIFFLAILLLLAVLLFFQLQAFIPAFLGALTFYVLMRKSMFRMVYVRKWKAGYSAALLMVTSFFVILAPIWMIINLISPRITLAIENSGEVRKKVNVLINNLENMLGFKLMNDTNLDKIGTFLTTNVSAILGATLNTLAALAMMYFMLYFMLVNGRRMERAIADFVPMGDTNLNKVGQEVNDMVVSNAIAIPLIAFLQGVVGLVGYLLIGVQEPVFWFVVTCVTAMLPVVGAALAYVPLAIIFFAQGQNFKGILMLIYGFGIIGLVDNVFRITLQKKLGDVHPLITILGVIVGLNLFGFIGLIFGPLLISLFVLLLKIYTLEFNKDQNGKLPHSQ